MSGQVGRPQQMRAAVLEGPGRLDVRTVPVPEVGPDDVLVEVELCGICGSDLHLVLEGWGRPGTWQGHEWVGQVVEVGSAVDRWHPGDAVVGGPRRPCGACAMCRSARPSLCAGRDAPGQEDPPGAFADYRITASAELLARPDGLDARAAALAEPLAVALHAATQGGIVPGHRVLVVGAGPIGALAVAALRAAGVEDVRCVEPGERRRALARELGADRVLVPEELEVPSIAEPGRVVDDAVDVVLECSGSARAMESGLAQLVRGGRLVLVGAGIEPPRFDPNRILLNELVVTGAYNYDAGGFEAALALLAGGALPVETLLEPGTVGLDGLLGAMRDLAEGRVAGKVLVRP
ncbi:zinc-dependent alcohol dehydrogenase [Dermatobacter hominis]|uniref:zinc-dependent alcohol dehydrogenase n=1 Tax=Dermatobacter hominis TaxID=2884263 RepID=UPI001D110B0C|nr:alcohol dehydrogenase catalytic domain-containing protein [Dermatobacter hominis]UDY35066.1 alcohol dehydrogenase catalytic domain-containing protein [Dermatobacter hominis]